MEVLMERSCGLSKSSALFFSVCCVVVVASELRAWSSVLLGLGFYAWDFGEETLSSRRSAKPGTSALIRKPKSNSIQSFTAPAGSENAECEGCLGSRRSKNVLIWKLELGFRVGRVSSDPGV